MLKKKKKESKQIINNQRIPITDCPYQLGTINKNNESLITIVPNNDLSTTYNL